ncbi:hypothetical protein ATEIFO6365_0008006500 [Aspergillus terreus]|uniref:Uncharacterized protein n=1 Tax=Aspergillus terreus TaxID=33178 RepID=A0A5M3Z613_ASPTE|nr:hypothetical protein ATETN484_0010007400 [Aspergillus terreus]GFF18124.1 hypothetical protein ATEIFO6365_0008006500 [Aspergillus terreus]
MASSSRASGFHQPGIRGSDSNPRDLERTTDLNKASRHARLPCDWMFDSSQRHPRLIPLSPLLNAFECEVASLKAQLCTKAATAGKEFSMCKHQLLLSDVLDVLETEMKVSRLRIIQLSTVNYESSAPAADSQAVPAEDQKYVLLYSALEQWDLAEECLTKLIRSDAHHLSPLCHHHLRLATVLDRIHVYMGLFEYGVKFEGDLAFRFRGMPNPSSTYLKGKDRIGQRFAQTSDNEPPNRGAPHVHLNKGTSAASYCHEWHLTEALSDQSPTLRRRKPYQQVSATEM